MPEAVRPCALGATIRKSAVRIGLRGSRSLLAFGSLLVAGCLSAGGDKADPSPFEPDIVVSAAPESTITTLPENASEPPPPPPPLAVATGCVEAGGYKISYGLPQTLPKPWAYIDASRRTGNPTFTGGAGFGIISGYYHPLVTCTSFRGAVGEGSGILLGLGIVQVRPPPFDDGAAAVHYLAFHAYSPLEAMRASLAEAGIAAGDGRGVFEAVGTNVLHVLTQDAAWGSYDARGVVGAVGNKATETVRIWFISEVEGALRPVAVDFLDEKGSHFASPGGATSVCQPTRSGVSPPEVCLILAFTGVDRTIVWGPRPDVVLEELFRV